MSSLTSAAAVVKLTEMPFWQAANPTPRAMWVLPVPLGPRAITFARRPIHSQESVPRRGVGAPTLGEIRA